MINDILLKIKNKIIISAQASFNEPFYSEKCMMALVESCILGGANALRLAGKRDIKNVKRKFPNIIVIGITKPKIIPDNYKEIVYITPGIKDVKEVIEAGADIVAFDCTKRNTNKLEIIKSIKNQNKLSMADISTYEEGIEAYNLGVDIISTTLSGYTNYSEAINDGPDFNLLKNLVKDVKIPVILEGRIWDREDVIKAFKIGAYSVVIGSSVTRPQLIVKRYIESIYNVQK